ncbi:hypothetical protein HX109_05585 [Galbibacter sp. BG1]|uniref:hypothetical protein n=1 Tax=Galbibacter sp. BG1 TaxID=1170699 RepID=UPI0015BA05A5|nr:hypothetical protein [Galbibacter sp. BG1]QLE01061.1 hypothetical protein HX109_05585 [Galbibacter sp. BG1]
MDSIKRHHLEQNIQRNIEQGVQTTLNNASMNESTYNLVPKLKASLRRRMDTIKMQVEVESRGAYSYVHSFENTYDGFRTHIKVIEAPSSGPPANSNEDSDAHTENWYNKFRSTYQSMIDEIDHKREKYYYRDFNGAKWDRLGNELKNFLSIDISGSTPRSETRFSRNKDGYGGMSFANDKGGYSGDLCLIREGGKNSDIFWAETGEAIDALKKFSKVGSKTNKNNNPDFGKLKADKNWASHFKGGNKTAKGIFNQTIGLKLKIVETIDDVWGVKFSAFSGREINPKKVKISLETHYPHVGSSRGYYYETMTIKRKDTIVEAIRAKEIMDERDSINKSKLEKAIEKYNEGLKDK